MQLCILKPHVLHHAAVCTSQCAHTWTAFYFSTCWISHRFCPSMPISNSQRHVCAHCAQRGSECSKGSMSNAYDTGRFAKLTLTADMVSVSESSSLTSLVWISKGANPSCTNVCFNAAVFFWVLWCVLVISKQPTTAPFRSSATSRRYRFSCHPTSTLASQSANGRSQLLAPQLLQWRCII